MREFENLQLRLATASAAICIAEKILDETARILEEARTDRKHLLAAIKRARLEDAVNYPSVLIG